ncbi:methyltransferase domain-containing protein [Nocardioides sp. BP30]|uniref:class I SAM-dependent methyltransferase n=1 Tax=Nocardioides sp. BP30 TaxID=3036374 RepID=UPI002468AD99|nr:methyltransferase domain-containing protein [Nocardioides sp. BP30]WGL53152.1 methyltransferase domain-containing protein [Nocardioides sp. BP30]
MRTAEELIAEAAAADVSGWGFGWLEGRASEERPPWGYAGILADRLARASVALDLDTGGGEVLAQALARAKRQPARMHACEAWPPNAARARSLLEPRGVEVHEVPPGAELPFDDGSFDLVTARHPVTPPWAQIARVLAPGGQYVAQHVGPASAFELIEFFLGPLPEHRAARAPEREAAAAAQAGLVVTDLRTARCRMELYDIGAVVWLLRKCVWWVPDFDVERYSDRLLALDELIRAEGGFVAHATRHLVVARRPD